MQEQQQDNARQLKTFKDAVAIITGGGGCIGQALAEELARKGAQAVVLVDRQSSLAEKVAQGLRDKGTRTEVKVYEVDVRDASDMETVVQETVEEYGRLDYMFNNAGTIVSGPLDKVGIEDFNYVLDVNLRGVVNGVKAAYPVMKEQGFGHIVNTAGASGLLPIGEGLAAYATSKYAIVGLSTNLRIEAARHGVNVSVLCPGFIDTPILKGGGEFGKDFSGIPPEAMDKIVTKDHPMKPKHYATKALKLVAKNRPIVIVRQERYKLRWFVNRMSPSLGLYLARRANDRIVIKKKAKKITRKSSKVIPEKKNE